MNNIKKTVWYFKLPSWRMPGGIKENSGCVLHYTYSSNGGKA